MYKKCFLEVLGYLILPNENTWRCMDSSAPGCLVAPWLLYLTLFFELSHFTYFSLFGLLTPWKSLLKVSSTPLNKLFVGGFTWSHCGFGSAGCHFHLLFHHVGVTKPPETPSWWELHYINRLYLLHWKHN